MAKTLLTIDFETYYAVDYTLKKGKGQLPVSLFVQDPRFKVHTLSYKTPTMSEAKCLWREQDRQEFFARLNRQRDNIILCGHNLHFDGYISSFHYGFVPHMYLCTLQLANAVHGVYRDVSLETLCQYYGLGEGKIKDVLGKWKGKHWVDMSVEERRELMHYNNVDVELTEQLLPHLTAHVPKHELWLQDLTVRAFCDPVLEVDGELAQQILTEQQDVKKAEAEAVGISGEVFRSNDKYFKELQERGYDPPLKWSDKQEKLIPAMAQGDVEYQRFVREGDKQLQRIAEARKVVKSTNVEAKAKALVARAGNPFPVGLMYAKAHTLRWTGTDKINPQNFNRDGRLRECLRAPPGHKLVIADASQIEARKTACVAGQDDVVEAFARGEDVYSVEASEIYGFEVNKHDNPDERFVGKTAVLGLGFQCGWSKYQTMLEVGAFGPAVYMVDQEAQRIVSSYRARRPYIVRTWYDLQDHIECFTGQREVRWRDLVTFKPGGLLLMPNGMHLHYPGLKARMGKFDRPEYQYMKYDVRYRKPVPTKIYGGLLLENIVQCIARCATSEHALVLSRYWRIVHLVHDEIIMCVPTAQAQSCLDHALEVMSRSPAWLPHCPLEAEGKIADYYMK